METSCPICGDAQRRIFDYRAHQYRRCVACDLVSTYPVPDSTTLARHYAERFRDGNYRLLREYSEQYLAVYEGFARVLTQRLWSSGRRLDGLRVLDIGCFTGEFLVLLQKRGADVYGLELQAEAVEVAAARLPGRVVRADVLEADLGDVPYDIVTLLGVIEHVVEPMALLRRSAALLAQGGLIMIQTPDSGSLFARTLGRLWPPYSPVEHIHLFSKTSLALALRTAGFTDVVAGPHWKRLPIAYVCEMFRSFGPEFHSWLAPLYRRLPQAVASRALPFYGGEIIVTARKA